MNSSSNRTGVVPTDSIAGRTRSDLVLLGVNHNTAPLEVRERLAIPGTRLAEATSALVHQPGVREAMIVSTCNRVELLTSMDAVADSTQPGAVGHRLQRFLQEFFAVPPNSLGPHLYEFHEREAVRHLFRVASSLDSLVVGEAQILGQVKESWTVAREVGAIAETLDPLLQRAFSVAKKVRTETQIGSSSVSVASVAVDLARKIFGTLHGKQVLIVGAGKMSELAARHLIQHGASTVLISNRTEARARQLAADLDTRVPTQIIPFDRLSAEAHRADIVITSTGAGGPGKLFTPADGRQFLERRRNRPMFFIDIAVPRDVDPGLNKIDGCFVYDIDDLQQVAVSNLASRSKEAAAAEAIVSREVERYHARLNTLDAVPAIRALQQQAEDLRQAELARSVARLGPLTPSQMEAIEAMTRSLTAKLLHPPLTAIRSAASEGNEALLQQLRALYTDAPGRGSARPSTHDIAVSDTPTDSE
jgi:glutamyl-tRNA reductase